MQQRIMKNIVLVGMVIVLAVVGAVFSGSGQAHADAVNPTLQSILDNQICPALQKIKGQKLGGNCKDYSTQTALDAAEGKICAKYGTNKLKSQCNAYTAAKASGVVGKGYSPPTTATPCGGGSEAVQVSIDIGCKGEGNPIADATFAIIRILSDGVGLVIVGSIVVGGIQYSASRGDPQATALAIGRIRSTLIALLIYIFGYAILNYIIPAGFLH
ncbi:MAG TPA: hypothetical protein VK712_00700 [Verrucomicrobiae bacterium]|jgi:hypothetical protein|nr:hypothetical protein [Verrucomicrobiae bacterium]